VKNNTLMDRTGSERNSRLHILGRFWDRYDTNDPKLSKSC